MHGNMNDSPNKMLNEKNKLQKKICENNFFNMGVKNMKTTTYYISKHKKYKSTKSTKVQKSAKSTKSTKVQKVQKVQKYKRSDGTININSV